MMTDTNPSTPAIAPPRASALRIGLIGAAAAALVAVGILAVAATASPGGILASNSSSGTSSSIPLNDGLGRFGGHDAAFGAISITAINGSSLSLKTADGWTRTITVDSGTTYSKSGTAIKLADLKVGDEIRFRETLESNGSYSIDWIEVILPSRYGTVTAVSGSTITLRLADGSTGTVKVDGSTTYAVGSNASAALSDVKVGMVLFAEGTANSDGSLTASAVRAGDLGSFGGPGHGMGRGWHDGDVAPNASASPST